MADGQTPTGPWKCFHCWETFSNPNLAAAHFGPTPESTPACVLRSERGLVYQLRKVELERDILMVRYNAHRIGEGEYEDEIVERFLAVREGVTGRPSASGKGG